MQIQELNSESLTSINMILDYRCFRSFLKKKLSPQPSRKKELLSTSKRYYELSKRLYSKNQESLSHIRPGVKAK
jgi:hypothetical protein